MTFIRIVKLAFARKLMLNLSSSDILENVSTHPLYKIKQNIGKRSWTTSLKTTNCTTLELKEPGIIYFEHCFYTWRYRLRERKCHWLRSYSSETLVFQFSIQGSCHYRNGQNQMPPQLLAFHARVFLSKASLSWVTKMLWVIKRNIPKD